MVFLPMRFRIPQNRQVIWGMAHKSGDSGLEKLVNW